MALTIFYLPGATQDLLRSAEWYEHRAPGLGNRFYEAVKALLGQVSANPKSHPAYSSSVRRGRIKTFPYHVYYFEEQEYLYVVAILHGRLSPPSIGRLIRRRRRRH